MLNDKINDKINSLDLKIIKAIKTSKYITILELAKRLKSSEATIHRHLDVLVKKKYIRRQGSRKTGYWQLLV